MINLTWEHNRKVWKGICPRCGVASYFQPLWSHNFQNDDRLDVVECPGGHPFVICVKEGTSKGTVRYVLPVSGEHAVHDWLPVQYNNLYSEMMFDFFSRKYASAVSVAGIILDAHINSFLNKNGDKRKGLKKRLEILSENRKIDADQFADSTVARLTRNEVVHPDDIANVVTEEDAKEVIDAVTACLERYYKFRRAKALPAPEEKVADPATADDVVEEIKGEK